jgi:hypothetical protein
VVIHCLGGRVLKPEILDTLPYDEARASLADLVRINRQWGGHSTLKRLIGEANPRENFSLLDVGAASGDMGACVRQWYPRARVTSLDLNASHLARCEEERVCGDAFRLPFRLAAFDFVFCSLFLHHFSDDEVVKLLAGFGDLARRAVLVIDLERNFIPYYFIPWTRRIFGWDPVTVNDAKISVEAAFRAEELKDLTKRAGFKDPRARVYYPGFRIAMIAET